jgi:transcriptional regulator with XRE-family HTH domain
VILLRINVFNGKKNISGDRIREARLKQRISQTELAAKMQVAGVMIERDSISRIENGSRFIPDYELPILSKILNVSVEWLLGMEECK